MFVERHCGNYYRHFIYFIYRPVRVIHLKLQLRLLSSPSLDVPLNESSKLVVNNH